MSLNQKAVDTKQLWSFKEEMSSFENSSLRFIPRKQVCLGSRVNSSWEEMISSQEKN